MSTSSSCLFSASVRVTREEAICSGGTAGEDGAAAAAAAAGEDEEEDDCALGAAEEGEPEEQAQATETGSIWKERREKKL